MPRRVVGTLPTRACRCIAAFFAPDIEREIRRRAERSRVGAGRVVERIVAGVIATELEQRRAELEQRRAKRARATPAGEQVPA